eukprot:5677376-Amphidinium_carterae.1
MHPAVNNLDHQAALMRLHVRSVNKLRVLNDASLNSDAEYVPKSGVLLRSLSTVSYGRLLELRSGWKNPSSICPVLFGLHVGDDWRPYSADNSSLVWRWCHNRSTELLPLDCSSFDRASLLPFSTTNVDRQH